VASALLCASLVLVGCGSSDAGSAASAPVSASPGSTIAVTQSSASATPTTQSSTIATATTVTSTMPSGDLAVDDPLVPGEQFQVVFAGRLRELRGGYFWLKTPEGARLALLRSDGNSEIPIGYSTDVTHATMLADGLSGERATLELPPDVAPGSYVLCTADSGDEECVDVQVRAA
jgi:hypothetical protein